MGKTMNTDTLTEQQQAKIDEQYMRKALAEAEAALREGDHLEEVRVGERLVLGAALEFV